LAFCGIKIDSNGSSQKVIGDISHPISQGYTCKKGQNIVQFYSSGRLTSPLVDGQTESFENSLNLLSTIIASNISQYGPDSIAIYLGTNAILDALTMWTALGFMYRINSRNIFTVSSIDGVNKIAAVDSITSGANPGLIPHIDFDKTDLIILIGTNPMNSHGHLAGMPAPQKKIAKLLKRSGKLVIIDPRSSKLAVMSTLHIQPLPGTDYAIIACLIRYLLKEERSTLDKSYLLRHTDGIQNLENSVERYDLEYVSRLCDIKLTQLRELCILVAHSPTISGATGTGVSFADSGIATEYLFWSLLALKRSLDCEGGTWFNNGCAEFIPKINSSLVREFDKGWLSNLFDYYHQDTVIPRRSAEGSISSISSEIESGRIKTLIVVGGNPLTAFPNASRFRSALCNLNLVVLDTHNTYMTDLANFSFPVAGPLERLDTTAYAISSASKPSLEIAQPMLEPCGSTVHGWRIFSEIGDRLNIDVTRLNKKTSDIADEEVLLSIKGVSEIADQYNIDVTMNSILFSDSREFGRVVNLLPEQKWRLCSPLLSKELKRLAENEFAIVTNLDSILSERLLLVSMREYENLNSQFIAGKIVPVNSFVNAFVSCSDCITLAIESGDVCRVSSIEDFILCNVISTNAIRKGAIAIPHGYPWSGNVARLTSDLKSTNPITGMPAQTGIWLYLTKANPQPIDGFG
jgi:anaerobic selenocysteine-containing dehydrogenase